MTMPAILAHFRHPYSFPAYSAMKATHAAGEVTAAEWAAYDEEIHSRGDSWLGFMRWNRKGVATMPEDRLDAYLDGLTGSTGLTYTHIAALDSYAPSYDEWAVMRLMAGKTPGTFGQYLRAIAPRLAEGDDMADEETN